MTQVTQRPDIDAIWGWLEEVPDPEIPVISLVDLGIIREIRYDDDTLVVVVTPTYSGCPATQVINDDIEAALRANGIDKLRLERRLSPAWTTDRSEEHTSELHHVAISYAVFCLNKKKK